MRLGAAGARRGGSGREPGGVGTSCAPLPRSSSCTEDITKWYLMRVAAPNLCVILRAVFAVGTPRGLQGMAGRLSSALGHLSVPLWSFRFVICASAGSDATARQHKYWPVSVAD